MSVDATIFATRGAPHVALFITLLLLSYARPGALEPLCVQGPPDLQMRQRQRQVGPESLSAERFWPFQIRTGRNRV